MSLIKTIYKYADKSAYIALLASLVIVSLTYYLCHHCKPYKHHQETVATNEQ